MSIIVIDKFERLQILLDSIQDIPSIKKFIIVENDKEKIKELNEKLDGKAIVTSIQDTMVSFFSFYIFITLF